MEIRADRIVRDMVTMGRGGGERQSVDINDLLRDRATIAFHSAIALDEDFEIDIPWGLRPRRRGAGSRTRGHGAGVLETSSATPAPP